MIFVASGTQDGRGLVEYLLKQNYKVMASVVTNYGKELLPKDENLIINDHKLDEEAMKNCLKENQIKVFVDATHPYAVNVSKTAMQVCDELNIPYIRYEREVTSIPAYNKLHLVKTYEEASDLAMQLGENIFLTTGSNRLDLFANDSKKYNKHIIARVLPAIASLQICENCGISPKDIVAVQGPFSESLNIALYEKYNADVVVMKNSGTLGGTETKLTAAIKLGLEIVIIDRPRIDYKNLTHDYDCVGIFVAKYEK